MKASPKPKAAPALRIASNCSQSPMISIGAWCSSLATTIILLTRSSSVRERGDREQHGDPPPARAAAGVAASTGRRRLLRARSARRLWDVRRTDDALRLCHVSPST